MTETSFEDTYTRFVDLCVGLGDTKVDEFDFPFVRDEEVARAGVSVDDAEVLPFFVRDMVCIVEGFGRLCADQGEKVVWYIVVVARVGVKTCAERAQILAMDVVHNDELDAICVIDAMHFYDVGVV